MPTMGASPSPGNSLPSPGLSSPSDKKASSSSAKRFPNSTQSNPSLSDNPLLQSIAVKTSSLGQPQVTLTCYIPSNSVGAVIGRGGSTIAQIQRQAQQVGANAPVRLSILGHQTEDDGGGGGSSSSDPPSSVPYTYSELDWSSPNWTPVVIRADPCAALAAGLLLKEKVEQLDEVVLDFPLGRVKHAALIGKRGLVLANLSADTNVRIMVPRRELRHDMVQLEGDLENVIACLERVLIIVSEKKKGAGSKFTKQDEAFCTVTVANLPPTTKLRNVGRKTDTVVKKKKVADSWELLVTGSSLDQVQSAVAMLQKWNDEYASNNGATNPGNANSSPAGNESPNGGVGTPSRQPKRNRQPGRNSKVQKGRNKPNKPEQCPS